MALDRLTKITGPGIATDHNWVGNNATFTGVTTTGSSFNVGVTTIHSTLIEAHNIKSTGIITATGAHFSGNVSIAGTLTYEDVTNIDSVGIITAPAVDIDDFLDVGSNIKLGNAGVITATSFVGSGAALTGIDATAIKDSGGNVKIQAQASGAIHSGVSTFQDIDVDGHTNLDNVSIAGVSTFSDDVTFTGASYNVTWDKSDNRLKFAEYSGIRLGNNNELQIDHRGTSYILNIDNMPLQIGSNSLQLTNAGTTQNYLNASVNGDLVLYRTGSERFRTKNYGIQVTGLTDTDSLLVSGISTLTGAIDANGDIDVDGHTNLDNVSIAGVTTTTETIRIQGNNKYLTVGASNQIGVVHTGGEAFITNSSGHLTHRSDVHKWENFAGSSEYFRIDSSGQMGIGLVSPGSLLHVYHATTNTIAQFQSGDAGAGILLKDNTHYTRLESTNGIFKIDVDAGGQIGSEAISLQISNSEKLRIDSNGVSGTVKNNFLQTEFQRHDNSSQHGPLSTSFSTDGNISATISNYQRGQRIIIRATVPCGIALSQGSGANYAGTSARIKVTNGSASTYSNDRAIWYRADGNGTHETTQNLFICLYINESNTDFSNGNTLTVTIEGKKNSGTGNSTHYIGGWSSVKEITVERYEKSL